MIRGVSVVAVLDLCLLAGLAGWVLQALVGAAWQYGRSGRVRRRHARRMVFRGAVAIAACALLTTLSAAGGLVQLLRCAGCG